MNTKVKILLLIYHNQLIRERYAIFKAHYGSLLRLSKMFPFRKITDWAFFFVGNANFIIDLINATGSIEQVMKIILREFEYQSSLELDAKTYDAISHIPLATQVGVHARQVM